MELYMSRYNRESEIKQKKCYMREIAYCEGNEIYNGIFLEGG